MGGLVDSIPEVFAGLGPIRIRRMFGVHGVYADEAFIAVLDDDVLYLKADDLSAPEFIARGLQRFEMTMYGRAVKMSFFQAPEEVFEDPDEALRWGRMAMEAALRSQASGKK